MFPQLGTAGFQEAVLINTGGGVAGGDRLDTEVTALADATITLTSQAAERIYGALDQPAQISTTLTAGATAKLAWCPQETIVFDRARVRRETRIAVSSAAELLALEWIVLGRAAHGERVVRGSVVDSWRVEQNGRLVWADTLRITDSVVRYRIIKLAPGTPDPPDLRASAVSDGSEAAAAPESIER